MLIKSTAAVDGVPEEASLMSSLPTEIKAKLRMC